MKYFKLVMVDGWNLKIKGMYDNKVACDADSIVVSEEELNRFNPNAIVNIDEYTRKR